MLFFIVSAIVLTMMVSCKDDFQESNPTPVPVEHKTVLNFNVDWQAFSELDVISVAKINNRVGREYYDATVIMEIYENLSQNISVVIPDSLRGTTCEMLFFVHYTFEGCGYAAEIVREVDFSSQDTTFLGNVGFSNYEWHTRPPLEVVIVPDGTMFYATWNKKGLFK